MSPTSRTPAAVRASVTDRLKTQARQHGQNDQIARRRFVMSRFLARIFDADPHGWVLKGGVGMMVRLPHARYSHDIDLLVADDSVDPIDDLRRVARDHHLDHFRFELSRPRPISGDKGTTVTVSAYLGGRQFDTFSIDLVTSRRPLVGDIERHPLPRLIDTDDFPPEGPVQLYPLADQIADKLCALYETFGPTRLPSGRFRDLVDLLLISEYLPIDLAPTVDAVERERDLRGISDMPDTLVSPGPAWTTQWTATAKSSPLTPEHYDLDTALGDAGRCYNRILQSLPSADTTAIWEHYTFQWRDNFSQQ
ncbi:MAG: nucleotidyl transferase AbiEii/AbiGii toxin family protein [Dietzia sp.]|nr:nucleotidyl transferase AbiEii/AbiGii toxin family protein [Dietzia sp.]MDO8395733.1 nucleotidyl transferase AbiEii/AbiGii toxin family protein [Dietzia sp.]